MTLQEIKDCKIGDTVVCTVSNIERVQNLPKKGSVGKVYSKDYDYVSIMWENDKTTINWCWFFEKGCHKSENIASFELKKGQQLEFEF